MRGFVGLELPEAVSRSLERALAEARREMPPTRWIQAENRHLTLAFLGPVETTLLPRLHRSLYSVFSAQTAFELELGGCGTFPVGRPGRVVWIGFRPSRSLQRLQSSVAEACRALGFDIEPRPFTPHLTLARCRRPWPRGTCEAWRELFPGGEGRAFEGAAFTVTQGCLFESVHGPRGVHYDLIRSYPLGERVPGSVRTSQVGQ